MVTQAGMRLALQAPEELDEWLWLAILERLRLVSAELATERVATVHIARAVQLQDALSHWPATQVEWQWDSGAALAAANAALADEELSRVVSQSTDEQECWPAAVRLDRTGFVRPLRDFQTRDVARLVNMGNGANFSVPGSGKTTVAYATFATLRAMDVVDAMLVVAPVSAFETWETEAHECFDEQRRPRIAVRPYIASRVDEVLVLNYEQLEQRRVLAAIDRWSGNRRILAVFDEAHRAKAGATGIRGQAARTVAQRSVRRMVLTGTPMPNGIEDLSNVFDLVWPGQGRRLADGDLAEVRERAFVRVTKSELDLPRLRLRVERVELEPAHHRLYQALAGHAAGVASAAEASAADLGKAVVRLIAAATSPATVLSPEVRFSIPMEASNPNLQALLDRPTAHIRPAKLVRAAQLVEANAQLGRKTLVWSNFVGNVHALRDLLARYSPAVVTGATPVQDHGAPTDRDRELTRFRRDSSCQVLIATPQTLGEGISLHRVCQDQIHVDRGFAAGTFLQSLDRTHRLGMRADSEPTCTLLVADNTIDARVHEILNAKVAAMSEALNDPSLRAVGDPAAHGTVNLEQLLLGDTGTNQLIQLLQARVGMPEGA